ncbi:MAG: RecQ family ATP-dependent DNA helicase [Saprospiraceae bacterium]|nr:RecQ family ATP-dependent DNA helicase [Saprospiraceae bacterium]
MTTPLSVLQHYWGYDQFRSSQKDIINAVLDGKDTLALLHTGAGKSVCYQVPALCLPGKTIVVSPLIALMQDQVEALNNKGIFARAIYSGLGYRQVDLILDNFVNGPLKILYVSPERLETDIFIERFKRADVSLIAIDEAHCISQWGHDFRPSYFNINTLRAFKPDVPIIAVTATATKKVALDITERLEFKDEVVFQSSFKRDNISFTVMMTEEKEEALLRVLSKVKGSGIIYLRSRSKVEQLSKFLNQRGILSSYYHGGLNMLTRSRVQKEWIDNKTQIIVSTNAFGMGVDKSNVRFVIHYDIPPSIEEYYQEAGRGGRDGKLAFAISIIGYSDIIKLQKFHLNSFPQLEILEQFYYRLCSYLKIGYGSGAGEAKEINLEDFGNMHRYSLSLVYSCLHILEKEGWLLLNEGIKNPSKIVFTTSKDKISLSTRNRGIKSQILLYLLRKYEGVFVDYTKVDEGTVANDLGLKMDTVVRELKVMQRETILDYIPSTELPKILFLLDRPAPKSFSIDAKRYKEREENARFKMRAIQEYMIGNTCRQKIILDYFGEKSTPCGLCDICKGSKESLFSDAEKEGLFKHLQGKLIAGKIDLEVYMKIWPYNKRNKAYACIQQLVQEQRLILDDLNILSLPTK